MNDFASAHRLSLTLRQWAGVLVFGSVVMLAAPRIWKAVEPLETGPTYRIPYDLSNDYWLWSRWAEKAVATHDTLLIGDSVVWGQYVKPGEALSDHLNALAGTVKYANLGVNGMQPAVLAGLIEHYGGAIRNKDVILHCNPLWMSSPRHDLREDEALINHAQLLPQFAGIRGYKDDIEARLGRVVDRNLPFRGWTNHLQTAYFDNASIPSWTKSHPRDNPLARVTLKLPPPEQIYHQEPVAWTVRGIKPSDLPWMALEESFQWTQFQRALDLLRSRGNRVKVVVGPFNEPMLKPESLARYAKLRDGIGDRLRGQKVEVVVPAALPSETYGDASHPLSAGYRILARRLLGLPEEAPATAAAVASSGAPVGGDFVKLPGGSFRMGDDLGRADEKPAREVRVEEFWIERTPVTQELYEKVMGVNPSKRKSPKHPVERIQWTDAARFLNKCSELDGLSPCYDPKTWACDLEADGYRLPTEAEWEYACRAGSTGRWAVEPAELGRYAWYKGNSEGRTRPVGEKAPNAFGLHDMNGNVWQWCNDWYGEGKPFDSAQGKQRVLRGGAWDSDVEKLRAAYRSKEFPTYTDACFGADSYGFRRARSGAGRKKAVAVSTSAVEAPKAVETAPQAAPGKLDASTLKGTIVFVGDRDGRLDLWIMKASGKDARRLTDDAHPDADPRFSPDGKKILYTTLRGGFPEVWSMNRDGSGAAKIAPGSQGDWSPDGRSIVFIRDNQTFVRELASGREKRITPEDWERCGVPAFSPDGKTVAVASRHEESIAIYLVPLAGGAPAKLKTEEACCTPAWTKDGSRLLCQSVKGHIHQVGVDGKDFEQVTFGADIQHDGRYSPDGKMFVFCRAPTAEGPWQICVKPFDGDDFDFVQLTKEGSNSHPDWSATE